MKLLGLLLLALAVGACDSAKKDEDGNLETNEAGGDGKACSDKYITAYNKASTTLQDAYAAYNAGEAENTVKSKGNAAVKACDALKKMSKNSCIAAQNGEQLQISYNDFADHCDEVKEFLKK